MGDYGAHVKDEDGNVFIILISAKDNSPHNKNDMRLNRDTSIVPVPMPYCVRDEF